MQRFSPCTISALNPRGCALITPLHAPTATDLIKQAVAVRGLADAVEVRLDALENLPQIIERSDFGFIEQIRQAASAPVIGTIRTREHGGQAELPFMEYAEGVAELAQVCEYVDVEWDSHMPPPIMLGLLEAVQKGGATEILSVHHWEEMPPLVQIDSFFADAAALGVKVAKIAVMPENQPQVAQLLQVVSRHAGGRMEILAIAMGEIGKPSRITGHLFGNCGTFAALPAEAGQPSAPGQIPAERLAPVLDAMAGISR
ncbi:type I 3-dehydroquinate dehydratase [Actinomycetaceae bacterium TAE3-ERU4]|nr:type I 3-dehydroquinate dehydratase [Actinomycetaceae bacterium TAE3-ERU4]